MKNLLCGLMSVAAVFGVWGLEWSGTVAYEATATISDPVTISGDVTVNVAKGKTVTVSGLISGTGSITKAGEGDLKFSNAANTYDGPTTISQGTLYAESVANIGEASSLGRPTVKENAALNLNAGYLRLGISLYDKSYATDRPITNNGCWIYFMNRTTLTVNGEWLGKYVYARADRGLVVNTYLGPSITSISRTNAGFIKFMCETNDFVAGIAANVGEIRATCLALDGNVSSLGKGGSGKKITFGQTAYTSRGEVWYDGTVDAAIDRGMTVNSYTNNYSHWTRDHGGFLGVQNAGTCLSCYSTITANWDKKYPASLVWFAVGGAGDGLLYSQLSEPFSFAKEGTGTWSLMADNTLTGLVIVANGRLDVNGSISADSYAENEYKVVLTNTTSVLGGTGTVYAATQVEKGGIAPGTKEVLGVLTFGEKLRLGGGAKLTFRRNGNDFDRIAVAGSVTFVGDAEVVFDDQGGDALPSGEYPLVTAGSLTVGGQLILTDAPAGYALAYDGESVKLVVPYSAEDGKSWTGGAAGTWDKSAVAWDDGSAFADGDIVVFPDIPGESAATVTVPEALVPAAVFVTADTTAYTFAGAGSLVGGMSYFQQGAAAVTNALACSYTGLTRVDQGSYALAGALANTSIQVADEASFTETPSGVISGAASLNLGFGTHWLQGENTFTGSVVYDVQNVTRDDPTELTLSGTRPLGYASSLRVTPHGKNNAAVKTFVALTDNTIVEGVPLIAEKITKAAAPYNEGRIYLGRTTAVSGGNVFTTGKGTSAWYGDVNQSSGCLLHISSEIGTFVLGNPNGANKVVCARGAACVLRGSARLDVHSYLDCMGISRTDGGDLHLFNPTNRITGESGLSHGTIFLEADGAWGSARLTMGDSSTTATIPAVMDFNGHTASCAGWRENIGTGYTTICRITNSAPVAATVTLSNMTADSIFGDARGSIGGKLNLIMAGGTGRVQTIGCANSFAGTVTVRSGTLALTHPQALTRANDLVIEGGTLDIAADITVTVLTLTENGRRLRSGLYTATGAAGTTKLDSLTGGGTLRVRGPYGTSIYFR